jgi:hypothetical protein
LQELVSSGPWEIAVACEQWHVRLLNNLRSIWWFHHCASVSHYHHSLRTYYMIRTILDCMWLDQERS